ncbi:hypothetical protein E2C01_044894 [Portunus trituberculatus]|uniref:Uncharacterized protein n=1 Tax=Portunus trituberculatus TaxID=210409 RepID=A0A5B7G0C9_PORTR|nr:hypothetical protein [Portunus trituberculatus]
MAVVQTIILRVQRHGVRIGIPGRVTAYNGTLSHTGLIDIQAAAAMTLAGWSPALIDYYINLSTRPIL